MVKDWDNLRIDLGNDMVPYIRLWESVDVFVHNNYLYYAFQIVEHEQHNRSHSNSGHCNLKMIDQFSPHNLYEERSFRP